MAQLVHRTGIDSYSLSSDTITRGNFTVNGSTIQLYPQTIQVDNFDSNTTQKYNANKTPISYSASLQSNNVLVLTDPNGHAITYFRGEEAFARGIS